MADSEATLQNNELYCGDKTITYTESVTSFPVSYLTIADSATSDDIIVTVTTPPTSVAAGTIQYDIYVALTDYPGVNYSIPLEIIW